MGYKARFEAREVTLPSTRRDTQSTPGYVGPERRRSDRRGGKDRRENVRFELQKEDRRKGNGRREEDHQPDFW